MPAVASTTMNEAMSSSALRKATCRYAHEGNVFSYQGGAPVMTPLIPVSGSMWGSSTDSETG